MDNSVSIGNSICYMLLPAVKDEVLFLQKWLWTLVFHVYLANIKGVANYTIANKATTTTKKNPSQNVVEPFRMRCHKAAHVTNKNNLEASRISTKVAQ